MRKPTVILRMGYRRLVWMADVLEMLRGGKGRTSAEKIDKNKTSANCMSRINSGDAYDRPDTECVSWQITKILKGPAAERLANYAAWLHRPVGHLTSGEMAPTLPMCGIWG